MCIKKKLFLNYKPLILDNELQNFFTYKTKKFVKINNENGVMNLKSKDIEIAGNLEVIAFFFKKVKNTFTLLDYVKNCAKTDLYLMSEYNYHKLYFIFIVNDSNNKLFLDFLYKNISNCILISRVAFTSLNIFNLFAGETYCIDLNQISMQFKFRIYSFFKIFNESELEGSIFFKSLGFFFDSVFYSINNYSDFKFFEKLTYNFVEQFNYKLIFQKIKVSFLKFYLLIKYMFFKLIKFISFYKIKCALREDN